jgi:hypothetical protein
MVAQSLSPPTTKINSPNTILMWGLLANNKKNNYLMINLIAA